MEYVYKITNKDNGIFTGWLNGSELLDATDEIMCEVEPDFEAWNTLESIQLLKDMGYTIEVKEIKEHQKAINKLNF